MSKFYANLDTYKRLVKMLAVQYGSKSEIILHDLTSGYESTIIAIENNHLTGRQVGDCGSNLGLEVLRQGYKSETSDTFGYLIHLKDGRILRSSSMYFYDENGVIEGCLCINTDITEMKTLSNYYNELVISADLDREAPEETFAKNVGELVDFFIEKFNQQRNTPQASFDKPERLEAIKYFDSKGVFLISKSTNKICKYLDISKGTLYTDLEAVRSSVAAEKDS